MRLRTMASWADLVIPAHRNLGKTTFTEAP